VAVLAGKVPDDKEIGLEVLTQRELLFLHASSAIKSRTRSKIDRRRTRKPCLIASWPTAWLKWDLPIMPLPA
jgi:hypothetical protein